MVAKIHRKSLYSSKVDKEYGKKREALEAKEGRVARKRMKDFTKITPAGKKTQWYY